MSDIKKQILTLLKQRHHSHKVALEQEKDPRSKHAVDLIARIREDSQLIELIDSLPEDDPLNDPRFCEGFDVGRAVQRIFDGTEESCKDSLQVQESCKENTNSFTEDLEEAAEELFETIEIQEHENIFEDTFKKIFIAGAEWQKKQDEDWLNEELMKAHLNGVMTGDRIARESLPMPEDTVIFQKGVAEGRRLEREDNNKALAEMYGYEGGTESPLVKITFTIPKEHFNRLMPIKQGDVFGIENLTDKEVVR